MRYVLVLVVGLLAGCAGGFPGQVRTGYQLAERYVEQTEQLYDTKAISGEEARRRLTQAQHAKAALDLAAVAAMKCPQFAQCADAKSAAALAAALVDQLRPYLQEAK